jgi:cytochrome c553
MFLRTVFFSAVCLVLATVSAGPSAGQTDTYQYDPDNAAEIMELCAGCHGEYGQGGGGGEYPRLAGLPAKYLATQMRAFRDGTRESMAMLPYANEREVPEDDMLDITSYMAQLELPTKMPFIDPDLPSLEKLLIASRVFNVPRLEGDTVLGEEIYRRQCQKCHGKSGVGRGAAPQLAGQYSDYLRLQISEFRAGKRIHKRMEKYLAPLTDEDVDNLLAYLSIADD